MFQKRRRETEGEELPFIYPIVETEEERIWMKSGVTQEEMVRLEGLSVFSLFEGTRDAEAFTTSDGL